MVSVLSLLSLLSLTLRATLALPLPKRDSSLPLPHEDPFYDTPSNLEALKPGQIYDIRQINPDVEYVGVDKVYQVAYRTTDTSGNASHTVATVFTPENPDPNTKLYSHQMWEDSDNIDCSPSYSLYVGRPSPDGVTNTVHALIHIEWALGNGYYVVSPDHEGPKSTFLAGFNAGYAGIDGIRAAIDYLKIATDTPVVMYGYSGGAHATVWMSELVGAYAPELNIVGAAHGGTPIDPRETMKFLDGSSSAGFVLGAFAGLLNAYPTVKSELWPYLDESLKNNLNTVWANDTCLLAIVDDYANENIHSMTSLPDFYAYPPLASLFENESLLSNVSSHQVAVPKFPRYIFHAVHDEVIPDFVAQQYVSQQCSQGANIEFVQWAGGNHATTAVFGMPTVMQFIKQAFEGDTPNVSCGTAPHDLLTLSTVGVGSVIGDDITGSIKSMDGDDTGFGKVDLDSARLN